MLGTDEWWNAIEDGRLPVHVDEGVISRVYWAGMGDWPEFALVTDEGRDVTWTRQGDITRYVEGLRCRVRYVIQRFKEGSLVANAGLAEHRLPLTVEIEESDRRSSPIAPGPGGVAVS